MVKNLNIQSAKIHIIFELAELFVDCETVLPENTRMEDNNRDLLRSCISHFAGVHPAEAQGYLSPV